MFPAGGEEALTANLWWAQCATPLWAAGRKTDIIFFRLCLLKGKYSGISTVWGAEFRQGTESTGFVIYCIYEVPKEKVMVSYGEGIVLFFVTDK